LIMLIPYIEEVVNKSDSPVVYVQFRALRRRAPVEQWLDRSAILEWCSHHYYSVIQCGGFSGRNTEDSYFGQLAIFVDESSLSAVCRYLETFPGGDVTYLVFEKHSVSN